MRKTLILTLVLCVAATFAYAQAPGTATTGTTATATTATTGTGGATTTTKTTKPHKPAAAKSGKGTVATVDATAKSFTVKPATGTGADWAFKTNDKTTYWAGKKKSTFDDVVKMGAAVTVKYHNDGTDNWALSVKGAAAAAAAKPAKTGR